MKRVQEPFHFPVFSIGETADKRSQSQHLFTLDDVGYPLMSGML
jgi:hypothetical protein